MQQYELSPLGARTFQRDDQIEMLKSLTGRYEYLRGDNEEKPEPECESGCVYRLLSLNKNFSPSQFELLFGKLQ